MTNTATVLDIQDIKAALLRQLREISPSRYQFLLLELKTGVGRDTIKKYLKGNIIKLDIATRIIQTWAEISGDKERLAS